MKSQKNKCNSWTNLARFVRTGAALGLLPMTMLWGNVRSGLASPTPPKGAHGEGKEHSISTKDDHERANARRAKEQKRAEERTQQQQRVRDSETEIQKIQRQNSEKAERYKALADAERNERDKQDPNSKQQRALEREQRFNEEARKRMQGQDESKLQEAKRQKLVEEDKLRQMNKTKPVNEEPE